MREGGKNWKGTTCGVLKVDTGRISKGMFFEINYSIQSKLANENVGGKITLLSGCFLPNTWDLAVQ